MKNVQNIKHPRGRHILQECLGSSELPTDTLVVSYHGHPGCLHFKKYCLVGGRVLVGGPGHAPPPAFPLNPALIMSTVGLTTTHCCDLTL